MSADTPPFPMRPLPTTEQERVRDFVWEAMDAALGRAQPDEPLYIAELRAILAKAKPMLQLQPDDALMGRIEAAAAASGQTVDEWALSCLEAAAPLSTAKPSRVPAG